MTTESYTTHVEVNRPTREVFNAVKDVAEWWSRDFEGGTAKVGDEFIINHPNLHYSKQKVVELIPEKKISWLVTESRLSWLRKNKEEWTGTRMIFEITGDDNKTSLHFEHVGLTPGKECFESCSKGWDIVIKNWLSHLITTGKPSAEMEKAAEIRNSHFEEKRRNKDFHQTVFVNTSAADAMKKIGQVDRWWKKDFSGSTEKLNDKFSVPFGDPSYVNFTVSNLVPNKKVTWKVTDCYLPWFENKNEWNDTEVVFELSEEDGMTKIDFTHIGLLPGIECYEVCEKGWNGHIDTLRRFINEGEGLAD